MTDRGACLVRGCTAAVFATLAAALSHIKTGGIALHLVLVLFPLSISALACVAVAWCVLSLKTLATVVVTNERLSPLALQALRQQLGPDRGQSGGVVMEGTSFTYPSMGPVAGHHLGMWCSPDATVAQILGFRCYGLTRAVRLLPAPLRGSIRLINPAEQGESCHHRLLARELWCLSLKS